MNGPSSRNRICKHTQTPSLLEFRRRGTSRAYFRRKLPMPNALPRSLSVAAGNPRNSTGGAVRDDLNAMRVASTYGVDVDYFFAQWR